MPRWSRADSCRSRLRISTGWWPSRRPTTKWPGSSACASGSAPSWRPRGTREQFGLRCLWSISMTDLGPLWLSLRVAAFATALIVAVGLPVAWVLARVNFRGKALVAGILVLPLVLPPTVLGYYLLQVLGRRALVGHWLEHTMGVTLVFHWSGAVVASAVAA